MVHSHKMKREGLATMEHGIVVHYYRCSRCGYLAKA